MEDMDRLLERDYEPSDKDVVKARLRTVGVQEYHFSIPRGMYSVPNTNEVPYLTLRQTGGTKTGSYTMLGAQGHP